MKNKKLFYVIFIIILIFSINVYANNNLTVHYLDVGQADSILIQLPSDQTMLIDAGNNADGDFVVDYIKYIEESCNEVSVTAS